MSVRVLNRLISTVRWIMWIKVPAGYVLYALPLVVWFIRNEMGHRELSIAWRSAKDTPRGNYTREH